MIEIVISIAGIIGITALIKFWNGIATWMHRYFIPWLEESLPQLKPLVESVFLKVDAVVCAVIQQLRRNWEELKKTFIGQIVYYEKVSTNVFIQTVCSYFRRIAGNKLDLDGKDFEEYKTVRNIDATGIPADFRKNILGYTSSKVNTTEHVESAIKQMESEVA